MSVKELNIECTDDELKTAINAAKSALDRTDSNQDRASFVRKAMDDRYGPAWSCVSGRDFGSELPYLPRHFAFFSVGDISFLVCKTSENVQITN
nr:dynein light chain [Hymenolepis microstoma]